MYTFEIEFYSTTLELDAVWEITFDVYGSYHPATRLDPEEWPETVITDIVVLNANRLVSVDDLSVSDEDCILGAIEEYMESSATEGDDGRNDWEYEKMRDDRLFSEEG